MVVRIGLVRGIARICGEKGPTRAEDYLTGHDNASEGD